MSALPDGMFACPHCQAHYPIKPVLVGRAVRCTSCKGAFRLRDDGIADPVSSSTSNPSGATSSAPPAGTKPAAPPATPAAPTEQRHAKQSTARPARSGSSRRLSQEQEELRKRMSASLSGITSEALQSEAVRRESQRIKREESRKKTQPGTGKTKKDGIELGPALLNDEGSQEARHRRQWLLGSVLGILVIAGLVFLFSGSSTERAALARFASAVPPDQAAPLLRIAYMRERAWIYDPGMPVIDDLDRSATLHGSQQIQLPRDVITNLLKDSDADLSSPAVVEAHLRSADVDGPTSAIVARLIGGSTQANGSNWIRDRLGAGDIPAAVTLQHFSGTTKRQLLPVPGNSVRTSAARYTGTLLKFEGWSGREDGKLLSDWAVFTVVTD